MPVQPQALPVPHKPFYRHLYVQVLCAIVIGILLGIFQPQLGETMKPLGDAFKIGRAHV